MVVSARATVAIVLSGLAIAGCGGGLSDEDFALGLQKPTAQPTCPGYLGDKRERNYEENCRTYERHFAARASDTQPYGAAAHASVKPPEAARPLAHPARSCVTRGDDMAPRLVAGGAIPVWRATATARPDGSARPADRLIAEGTIAAFGGFIYPRGGGTVCQFELDAPLVLEPAGVPYYSFSVWIDAVGENVPALHLVGRQPKPGEVLGPELTRLDAPEALCGGAADRDTWPTPMWTGMIAVAMKHAGRPFYAIPADWPEAEAKMRGSAVGVYFESCASRALGRASEGRRARELVVFVRAAALTQFNRLVFATRLSRSADGAPSDVVPALEIHIYPSPRMVAVFGDSTAWSQGNAFREKRWVRMGQHVTFPRALGFDRRIIDRVGGRAGIGPQPDTPFTWIGSNARIDAPAHSGAITGNPLALRYLDAPSPGDPHGFALGPVAPIEPDCQAEYRRDWGTAASAWYQSGEIPRLRPDLACQALHTAIRYQEPLTGRTSGFGGVEGAWLDHSVARKARLGHLGWNPDAEVYHLGDRAMALNGGAANVAFDLKFVKPGVPRNLHRFDHGPRYDLILVHTCINDVGPVAIMTLKMLTREQMKREVERRCDIAAMLTRLRRYFPNAAIVVHGYHAIAAKELKLCENWLQAFAQRLALRIGNAIGEGIFKDGAEGWGLSERSRYFQEESERVLSASVVQARKDTAEAPGRGTIVMARTSHALTTDTGAGREPSHVHFIKCDTTFPTIGQFFRTAMLKEVPDPKFVSAGSPQIEKEREDICRKFHTGYPLKNPGGAMLFCFLAPYFHPNAKGAAVFAREAARALCDARSELEERGWLSGVTLNCPPRPR